MDPGSVLNPIGGKHKLVPWMTHPSIPSLQGGVGVGGLLLWQHFQAGRNQGYHFQRQQCIGLFIVDFYCHKAALVVEVDGGIHPSLPSHRRLYCPLKWNAPIQWAD